MKSETNSNSASNSPIPAFADAPPSYDNAARIVTRPSQLPNNAGRVIILSNGNTQFGTAHDKYSCGNPLVEVAERLSRLLFFVIMVTYAGLAIATADNRHSLPDYPNQTTEGYDEEYEDERASVDFNRFLIIFVLGSSLCCTFGVMICDLPCLIGHLVTSKVMNNPVFRALDIARWIILAIMYCIVLIMLLILPVTRYPLTTALFCFLSFIILMGVIMVLWDCGHLLSSSTKPSSQSNTVQLIVPQQTV